MNLPIQSIKSTRILVQSYVMEEVITEISFVLVERRNDEWLAVVWVPEINSLALHQK